MNNLWYKTLGIYYFKFKCITVRTVFVDLSYISIDVTFRNIIKLIYLNLIVSEKTILRFLLKQVFYDIQFGVVFQKSRP